MTFRLYKINIFRKQKYSSKTGSFDSKKTKKVRETILKIVSGETDSTILEESKKKYFQKSAEQKFKKNFHSLAGEKLPQTNDRKISTDNCIQWSIIKESKKFSICKLAPRTRMKDIAFVR